MDYPYIIILFFLLILSYLKWKNPTLKCDNIALAIFFLFIALRAPVVGADTWGYVNYLSGIKNYYNYDSRELEFGFLFYRSILAPLKLPSVFITLINTTFTLFPLCLILRKYSSNIALSLSLFFLLSLHTVWFIALRQILAVSCIYYGIYLILENRKNKWIIYTLLSLIAYTLHTTAILYSGISLLAYFIIFKNRMFPILLISITLIVGVILESFNLTAFFDFYLKLNIDVTSRIDTYMLNFESKENAATLLGKIALPVLAIIFFALVDKKFINHWLAKLFFCGIILNNLLYQVPMIFRISGPLIIFGILALTWILDQKKVNLDSSMKRRLNIIFFITIIYLIRSYTINNIDYDKFSDSRMHPYQFFFEDYSKHPALKYFKY